REGAIILCPVKIPGGGVYLGDMHAMQGNGEIAGHTTDVAGIVDLNVKVIKNLNIDGPILLPIEEDLPPVAKPFTAAEIKKAKQLAAEWSIEKLEASYPLSFVGTGAALNEATMNGLDRAAKFLGIEITEVMNRATITGSIDIGRNPGVVTVTFLVPLTLLEKVKLDKLAEKHYG